MAVNEHHTSSCMEHKRKKLNQNLQVNVKFMRHTRLKVLLLIIANPIMTLTLATDMQNPRCTTSVLNILIKFITEALEILEIHQTNVSQRQMDW